MFQGRMWRGALVAAATVALVTGSSTYIKASHPAAAAPPIPPAGAAAAPPSTQTPAARPTTTTLGPRPAQPGDEPRPSRPARPAPGAPPTVAQVAHAAPAAPAAKAAPGVTTRSSTGLTVRSGRLTLDGTNYHDVGVDAYELGTDWGINNGCGAMLNDTQMNAFFASLPPHTLVRFWAWQGTMAVNVHTGQIDWGPLDRVFNAAAAHGDLLIASLTSQGGECDDNVWKSPAWYSGGYRQTYGPNTNGTVLPLSYWQYLQAIVARYAHSPALGMWELVNEPEASTCPPGYSGVTCSGHQTCPNETAAAQSLRSFFDTVGAKIHSIDPTGLVEAGFLGAGQCGTSGTDYAYVGASAGVDVLSYHDYYPANQAVGGDQWNGIAVRAAQAASLGKPLIAGEVGIVGGTGSVSGCQALSTRSGDFAAKFRGQEQLGVEALLIWNWVPPPAYNCSYDVPSGDPSMGLLGPF